MGIVDYKTGRAPKSGEEKKGYTRQLIIYALAAEKLFKQPVKTAHLHFLQNNSSWGLNGEREEQREALKALCAEIKSKKEEQDFSVLPENCKYCVFNYFCKKQ